MTWKISEENYEFLDFHKSILRYSLSRYDYTIFLQIISVSYGIIFMRKHNRSPDQVQIVTILPADLSWLPHVSYDYSHAARNIANSAA